MSLLRGGVPYALRRTDDLLQADAAVLLLRPALCLPVRPRGAVLDRVPRHHMRGQQQAEGPGGCSAVYHGRVDCSREVSAENPDQPRNEELRRLNWTRCVPNNGIAIYATLLHNACDSIPCMFIE